METLRNFFLNKDKPMMNRLIFMALLGVVLLTVSANFFENDGKAENMLPLAQEEKASAINAESSYEKNLEERLSAVLSKVEGAGQVDVMLTLSYGNEIVVAEDISSNETNVTEVDSAGGTRENQTKTVDNKKILVQSSQGGQQPLIVKEIVPKVEGVIIVAEGGDEILIKEALINAAKTVLGIEIHKVQVLKMK